MVRMRARPTGRIEKFEFGGKTGWRGDTSFVHNDAATANERQATKQHDGGSSARANGQGP